MCVFGENTVLWLHVRCVTGFAGRLKYNTTEGQQFKQKDVKQKDVWTTKIQLTWLLRKTKLL